MLQRFEEGVLIVIWGSASWVAHKTHNWAGAPVSGRNYSEKMPLFRLDNHYNLAIRYRRRLDSSTLLSGFFVITLGIKKP